MFQNTEQTNIISPFPASSPNTAPDSNSKNEGSEISESSHNNSITDRDSLVPLGNPELKDLKYIENEIPIYANLYKIELERNYTLYEYAVNFIQLSIYLPSLFFIEIAKASSLLFLS